MAVENPTASRPVVYKYIVQSKVVLLVILDYGNPMGNFFFHTSGRYRFYMASQFRDQIIIWKKNCLPSTIVAPTTHSIPDLSVVVEACEIACWAIAVITAANIENLVCCMRCENACPAQMVA